MDRRNATEAGGSSGNDNEEWASVRQGPSCSSSSTSGGANKSSFRQYNDLLGDIITRLSTTTSADEEGEKTKDQYNDNEKQPLLSSSSSTSTSRSHRLHNQSSARSDSFTAMGATKENPRNDGEHYHHNLDDQSSHHSAFIYLVTFLSAIGGFLFGYDTGIVSGAMVFIRDYFKLSKVWQEVIVSITILGAWMFSLISGFLTNKFGRKWIVVLASFIFSIGGFMMAMAQDRYLLLVGRFTVGAAIGLASMVIPVYIAEVAPVQIRGKLVTINTCFITFGQFVASILAGLFSHDHEHGWRWMLGLASVPSLIQLVCFIFLPESPRWLIQKGRYEEAYRALAKFRSNTSSREIDAEFDSIKDNCLASQQVEKPANISRILRTPSIRRALFVGCLLMMFQQLAGINTVMYYSATIIQMSGVSDNSTAVWLSAATASINFVFSLVGLLLVERLGRRLLTLSSLLGVVMALAVLGVGFQLSENHSPEVSFHSANQSGCSKVNTCNQCVTTSSCGFCFFDTPNNLVDHSNSKLTFASLFQGSSHINGTCLTYDPEQSLHSNNSMFCLNGTKGPEVWTTNWCPSNYSWMILGGLMLYLLFFAPGMGPMPWTINSEIYPLWSRSFCYSVSTSVNWLFNLLVSLTFLTLTEVLTNHGAYYMYACVAFTGWCLFFVFLPETKGKTLEEIETVFEGPLLKLRQRKESERNYAHMDSGSETASTGASTVKV